MNSLAASTAPSPSPFITGELKLDGCQSMNDVLKKMSKNRSPSRITVIDLRNTQCTEEAASSLGRFPNLEVLRLPALMCTQKALQALSTLKSLQELEVAGEAHKRIALTADIVKELGRGFQAVRTVKFLEFTFDREATIALSRLRTLTSLHLSGKATSAHPVFDLCSWNHLTTFVIGGKASSAALLKQRKAANIGKYSHLQDLELLIENHPGILCLQLPTNRAVTDQWLPSLKPLKDLRDLLLYESSITPTGISILADNHTKLATLGLNCELLTRTTPKELSAALSQLKQLTKIGFKHGNDPIAVDPHVICAMINALPQLELLQLQKMKLSSFVAFALQSKKLQMLNCGDSIITELFFERLCELHTMGFLSKLTIINLKGSKMVASNSELMRPDALARAEPIEADHLPTRAARAWRVLQVKLPNLQVFV